MFSDVNQIKSSNKPKISLHVPLTLVLPKIRVTIMLLCFKFYKQTPKAIDLELCGLVYYSARWCRGWGDEFRMTGPMEYFCNFLINK